MTRTPAYAPPESRLSAVDSARLIARSTFADSARRRGSWTTTLLTGLLFAVLIVGSGSVSERVQQRAESTSFRVAVTGDADGAAAFLERLGSDQLRIDQRADAANEVATSKAAVGLNLPAGLDAKLARHEPAELAVYYRGGANVSREAYNTLLLRVQEIQLGLLEAPVDVGPQVQVEERQVRRDERVNRLQFARTLAALSAVLCLGVVSSVSSVLGRSRERRSLEPLLLLPCARRTVVAGIAAGTLPVAILQLFAAVGLLVVGSTLPLIGLSLSLSSAAHVLAVSLAGTVLLGSLACSTGCLAGVLGTGSDDAVSLGDFLALPFVGVGVLLFLQPAVGSSALAFAIPILGPALLLRDGVGGELSWLDAGIAIMSTALWCSLLISVASRRLDDERSIVRGTT